MSETDRRSGHYRFSVRVSPEALRNASLFYMWRRFRWRYIAGWAGAGLGAAAYSMTDLGLMTAVLGIVTAALVLVLLLYPFAIWYAIRRTVEGYDRLTGGMPVEYEVDEEWFISRYANDSGELRWSTFKEVLKTADVWLLVLAAEDRFIPIPVEQAPRSALELIERRVGEEGPDG